VSAIAKAAGSLLAASVLASGVLLVTAGGDGARADATLPAPGRGTVGLDTYRRLDLLPLLHTGTQTLQASSYDRRGANDDGASGRYSCLRHVARRCVIAQRAGAGEIDSMWFTRNHAALAQTGTLRIELDGRTVLDASLASVVAGRLGAPFAFPLVAGPRQSSGAGYVKVPMTFDRSMRVSTQRNPHYYHVSYRAFDDAAGLATFKRSADTADVLATLRAAGTTDPKPPLPGASTSSRSFAVPAGGRATIASTTGAGVLTALSLRFGGPLSRALIEGVRLQVTVDGRQTVDAPLGQFFGSGLAPASVRSLMVAQGRDGSFDSWWPMPQRDAATVELVNTTANPVSTATAQATFAPSVDWGAALERGDAGYFHATAHAGPTRPGHDWPILTTTGRGTLVGLTQTADGPRTRRHLEGDEHIDVDGRRTWPGTGTDDLYEGGFYFLHGPFTLPLTGNPIHLRGPAGGCRADCTSAYRLLLADAVPFRSSLRFGIEHGDRNRVAGTYATTAYWYGAP
jgi:hypothetical protein